MKQYADCSCFKILFKNLLSNIYLLEQKEHIINISKSTGNIIAGAEV